LMTNLTSLIHEKVQVSVGSVLAQSDKEES